MQRAESYAALAPLLSAQLRRGVVTNCFLSAEDYQRELPRGLYYANDAGGLDSRCGWPAHFRCRDGGAPLRSIGFHQVVDHGGHVRIVKLGGFVQAGPDFVAIPAVLAYNAFTRSNRLVAVQLDGFAHDLHAYLTTGVRVGGNAHLVDIGAVRAKQAV